MGSDERTKNWVVIMTAVLGLVPLAVCITTVWKVMTSWRSRRGLTNPPPPAAGGGETVDVVESTTHQNPINPPPPAAGGGETVDVVESTTHQSPINPPPPAFGGGEEEDVGAMLERVQPPFYRRAVEEAAAALSALSNLPPADDSPFDEEEALKAFNEEEALKEFRTPGTVRYAYKMLLNRWSAEPDDARAAIISERIKLFQDTYPHLFLGGFPRPSPGASSSGGGTEEAESSSTCATTGVVHGHDQDAE